MKYDDVCVIIPAKKISVRLLNKNRMQLGEEFIFDMTIADAKTVTNNIFVITDDEYLVERATSLCVSTIDRPENCSNINDEIFKLKELFMQFDKAIILDCNELRTNKQIVTNGYHLLTNDTTGFVPVIQCGMFHPEWVVPISNNIVDISHIKDASALTPQYHLYGGAYGFWTENLTKFNNLYGDVVAALMLKQMDCIHIDTFLDYKIAETVYKCIMT